MQVVLSELPPSSFPDEIGAHVWLPRIYINLPDRFRARSVRVINLSRECDYLGTGYYASLLAEARGHKVIPSIRTLLDLSKKSLYQLGLPELDAPLAADLKRLRELPCEQVQLLVAFGRTSDARFREFARAVFDRFRHPLLRVTVSPGRNGSWRVSGLKPAYSAELGPEDFECFSGALAHHLRVRWRTRPPRPQPRYSIAMLHNPEDRLPPSSPEALARFIRVGAAMGIEVELIKKADLLRLSEFDALFIRETTALEDHTYRFARKAEREGLPVIDDPQSIVRCTNKVYLAELLAQHGLPTPKTAVLDRQHLRGAGALLGFPAVLKVPDGAFSRGVFKVQDEAELRRVASRLLEDSDLILAQEFVPTTFDWRVGVLARQPLYVCQYFMPKNHWQILKHEPDGRVQEGSFRTFAVEDAPRAVVDLGCRAASLIGDGLYGVDLKQTERGFVVIEVNDNPSLEVGVEDAVLKDELYRRVLGELVRRIEGRRAEPKPMAGAVPVAAK